MLYKKFFHIFKLNKNIGLSKIKFRKTNYLNNLIEIFLIHLVRKQSLIKGFRLCKITTKEVNCIQYI